MTLTISAPLLGELSPETLIRVALMRAPLAKLCLWEGCELGGFDTVMSDCRFKLHPLEGKSPRLLRS